MEENFFKLGDKLLGDVSKTRKPSRFKKKKNVDFSPKSFNRQLRRMRKGMRGTY